MKIKSLHLHTQQYILFLICLGIVLFSNIIPHGFALDDFKQIVHNPSINHLGNIPDFFTKSFLFYPQYKDITNYFYRPFFYTVYALLFALGHGSALPFHLFQVSLYITNCVFIFLFFSHIFKQKTAFFLTLLFLIHPNNEEVAGYIANIQDCLFFFFGMSSLLLLQTSWKDKRKTTFFIGLLLLCSYLSKETTVLFAVVIPLYLFFQKDNLWKRYAIVSLISTLCYGLLRLYASRNFLSTMMTSYTHGSTSFHQRYILIPKVVAYQLQDLLIPIPNLIVSHILAVSTFTAWTIILVTVLSIIISGWIVCKVKPASFHYFAFFSIWFLIGVIFHSQIIPLDVLVAKRWMYFSLVGLLGDLAILSQIYISSVKTGKYFLVGIYCLYLVFFTVETELMNSYWASVHEDIVQTHIQMLPSK